MGRNSFGKVLSFPQWPYEEKRVVVMTRSLVSVPEEAGGRVELFGGTPRELVDMLKAGGEKHLYIDGGLVIQSFLQAGLIHEITVSRLPILLGQGLPLFGPLDGDIRLKHLETKAYPSGLVQSKYACRTPMG